MQEYLQIFALIVIGSALLWFGFNILFGQWGRIRSDHQHHSWLKDRKPAAPNDPQACPICSSKLVRGELVKTLAFPSLNGGKDRLMHIRGCRYCINGGLERNCPVCGTSLDLSDILVARIFERPNHRAHVHITGCNKCRRTGRI
jgi:endogenous inhibitor of DNA gyrase (YacG/DUF329 family)